ncbi:sigma-70 family RNA polymerase sigma factor [Clostridium sporogenes]|uniref:Sigma-70 family RNA polymerase sigma factor n=3 Tax=Clostridiaceae TaxID=31979 RepID=A0ABR8PSD5_9CLOT|nr:sigma-70 family RNA polymerase sigma factor [Clostridium cibarium]NFG95787.1 sigma-70 family RNA polymerase sigma factor [Clostridium sporogenes]NFH33463.1 sigma-70 family RNA polymerase sigma factor [Clostridium sporogenes]NFH48574.1 sigma-70 family RNA polymerase sigma factor [Clostridium sporogenes]NFL19303.1 sigma-70 family RNA polymerase sigma factor [Clostridium sporogenes]
MLCVAIEVPYLVALIFRTKGLCTSRHRPIFVSFAANAVRRKGCKMKIRIQHENKSIYLEVPDEDFTLMIDADYEDRLSSVEDKETVTRRSPQEIMDERFNKPEYNNWHKFDRHRGMPKKPFRKDDESEDATDHMDYFPDNTDEVTREKQVEYEYLCEIIRKTLKEKQAELLIAIFLDGVSVTEYAEREGVSKSAISHRLDTAKKNFKKVFPESSTFPSCQG